MPYIRIYTYIYISHRIHGTGISLYLLIYHNFFAVYVGKYTSPVDPIGINQVTQMERV